jgi:mannosyltransferase OCH1-like enzyme
VIPRRVIRTNRSAHISEPVVPGCGAALAALLPDYEHLFFDDFAARDFIGERRPALLPLYDGFLRNVQRADLFRFVAVAELGGFYLDMDILLFRPLDELCAGALVFPFERNFTAETFQRRHRRPHSGDGQLAQIGNYGFGAAAGHWFLEEVISEIERRSDDLTARTHPVDVLWTTGPDCLNAVLHRHHQRLRGELRILRGAPSPKDLESCGWEPCHHPDWYHFGPWGTHRMTSTWRAPW